MYNAFYSKYVEIFAESIDDEDREAWDGKIHIKTEIDAAIDPTDWPTGAAFQKVASHTMAYNIGPPSAKRVAAKGFSCEVTTFRQE